ncbi:transposase [Streptomyces natalensis]|uniref:transposase n=1 Tax=Streptomyces natalensis TaxID=68242 RepID=UPI003B82D368
MRRPDEPDNHALGRSRGGLTTKIHLACDGLGRPLAIMPSPGQRHDSTCARPLLECIRVPRTGLGRTRCRPDQVIADKAYSSRGFRTYLRKRGIAAILPGMSRGSRSERGKSNESVGLGLFEDALDDFGLFGLAGAEVAGSGFDGGQTEEGLDLGGVGSAFFGAGGSRRCGGSGEAEGRGGGVGPTSEPDRTLGRRPAFVLCVSGDGLLSSRSAPRFTLWSQASLATPSEATLSVSSLLTCSMSAVPPFPVHCCSSPAT